MNTYSVQEKKNFLKLLEDKYKSRKVIKLRGEEALKAITLNEEGYLFNVRSLRTNQPYSIEFYPRDPITPKGYDFLYEKNLYLRIRNHTAVMIVRDVFTVAAFVIGVILTIKQIVEP